MFKHEDDRRCLIEWAVAKPRRAFKECKVATMKAAGVLGNHWHAKKDEVFYLLSGWASKIVIGDEVFKDVSAGKREFEVPRGTWHEFHLAAGSVLLGAATELFDNGDERTDPPPKAGIK